MLGTHVRMYPYLPRRAPSVRANLPYCTPLLTPPWPPRRALLYALTYPAGHTCTYPAVPFLYALTYPAALDTQILHVDNPNQCSFIALEELRRLTLLYITQQISNPATLPQEINPSIPQVAIAIIPFVPLEQPVLQSSMPFQRLALTQDSCAFELFLLSDRVFLSPSL